jgi:hypothetical protein
LEFKGNEFRQHDGRFWPLFQPAIFRLLFSSIGLRLGMAGQSGIGASWNLHVK